VFEGDPGSDLVHGSCSLLGAKPGKKPKQHTAQVAIATNHAAPTGDA